MQAQKEHLLHLNAKSNHVQWQFQIKKKQRLDYMCKRYARVLYSYFFWNTSELYNKQFKVNKWSFVGYSVVISNVILISYIMTTSYVAQSGFTCSSRYQQ